MGNCYDTCIPVRDSTVEEPLQGVSQFLFLLKYIQWFEPVGRILGFLRPPNRCLKQSEPQNRQQASSLKYDAFLLDNQCYV